MNIEKHKLHEKETFVNMRDLVERMCEKHGTKPAYSFKLDPRDKEKQTVDFNTLRDDIRALTSKLIADGIKGKHCAVVG